MCSYEGKRADLRWPEFDEFVSSYLLILTITTTRNYKEIWGINSSQIGSRAHNHLLVLGCIFATATIEKNTFLSMHSSNDWRIYGAVHFDVKALHLILICSWKAVKNDLKKPEG